MAGKSWEALREAGWESVTIKAGTTRSRRIDYNPSTFRLDVAKERFGAVGSEPPEDVPEVEVEETPQGGFLVIDQTLEDDLMMAVRVLPEIRK